jgi:uncharacterized protein YecE (DUF72 family)
LRLYIGCSGWSYTSWQGPFYPSSIENKLWLPYYSQILNYVEIDSTFYRIPSEFMVKKWNRRTPDNFRFNTDKFKTVIPYLQMTNIENLDERRITTKRWFMVGFWGIA